MSELLGRKVQYYCIDEYEPPVHEWSFDSGWINLGVTGSIIQMLQDLAVPRRRMVKKPLIYILHETYLNELLRNWFRTDVQNRIKYNAIFKEVFENGKQYNPKDF